MGLLNHMCQINNTCVAFGTREYIYCAAKTIMDLYYSLIVCF